PKPPKFKHAPIAITYMQKAIVHEHNSDKIRLSLPKNLMKYMSDTYNISDKFLYLENTIFKGTNTIKQIRIYPPEDNVCEIIIIYEVDDVIPLSDNGRYLSIDVGLHNLMTCYNSNTSETFIVGRKYLSICQRYDKRIAETQERWYKIQSLNGIEYPKSSKHIKSLYKKRNNSIKDYLHKVTKVIVDYCINNNINTVVIGDITGIRKDNDLGSKTNQKFHSLPYAKIYTMLKYKLSLCGIKFVMQQEAYSSQTSPLMPKVSKKYAAKSNRVKRGLYKDGAYEWNADCVGAYNILRLYLDKNKIKMTLNPTGIKSPYILKVAA
ncbi:MAG: transposase, partial [Lachnospiraceae bacterium]|nr:transposase [Lachnospiraceae bacterium]